MTLIELIVTITIASILIMLGVPNFVRWIRDAAVRSQTEQLQAAILATRSYAVARNERVSMQFTEKNGDPIWKIGCIRVMPTCPEIIVLKSPSANSAIGIGVMRSNGKNSINAPLAVGEGLPGGINFNSQGILSNLEKDENITRVDIMHKDNSEIHRLVLKIEMGGEVKLCNPLTKKNNEEFCE